MERKGLKSETSAITSHEPNKRSRNRGLSAHATKKDILGNDRPVSIDRRGQSMNESFCMMSVQIPAYKCGSKLMNTMVEAPGLKKMVNTGRIGWSALSFE